MCGILGVVGAAAERMSEAEFVARLERMRLRGPDGQGLYAEPGVRIGMRRLAVIDLAGGQQPFLSGDGDIVAFQNGEIYNHKDLRNELEKLGYTFTSRCDTEVLAHGFHAWGIRELLRRIDGMFAIAVLDRRNRSLHLARDRFGEKPLFVAIGPDSMAFGSDLRTLRDLDFVDDELDPFALSRYLALHYVPGRRTIHRGIRRVLPGERLQIDLDHMQCSFEFYYRSKCDTLAAFDPDRLLELLRRAVTSRLESDVPIGIFLSGGLDSSLMTALAVQSHPAISTFSMGFNDPSCDESREAQLVARAFGTAHHHFVFCEDKFHNLIVDVVAALDEPIGDQAMLPLFWLCREARRDCTVVLSGEGADEAFGGYAYYRGVSSSLPTGLLQGPGNSTPSGFPLLTSASERDSLLLVPVDDADYWEHAILARVAACSNGPQARGYVDALTWLPDDLLVKFDRIAMANSLEGRAPYLMPELFEYGLRLPEAWRLDPTRSKVALRHVSADLLPDAVCRSPKRGFVLPMRAWLSSWFEKAGPVRAYVEERCPSALDPEAVSRTIATDLGRGVKRERLLFALVVLLEWSARNGYSAAKH